MQTPTNLIPYVEAASKHFVGMMNAGDEAEIIKFAEMQQVMQVFTSDQVLLTAAIGITPTLIGREDQTHLYDALYFAVGEVAKRQNIKAVVAITDGKDENNLHVPNVSVHSLAEVISFATSTGVVIYPVGLGNVDFAVMNQLASETGGQFYYITDTNQLDGVYGAIRNILSGKYSIQYITSVHGSTPITLSIDVFSVGGAEGVSELQVAGCP